MGFGKPEKPRAQKITMQSMVGTGDWDVVEADEDYLFGECYRTGDGLLARRESTGNVQLSRICRFTGRPMGEPLVMTPGAAIRDGFFGVKQSTDEEAGVTCATWRGGGWELKVSNEGCHLYREGQG